MFVGCFHIYKPQVLHGFVSHENLAPKSRSDPPWCLLVRRRSTRPAASTASTARIDGWQSEKMSTLTFPFPDSRRSIRSIARSSAR